MSFRSWVFPARGFFRINKLIYKSTIMKKQEIKKTEGYKVVRAVFFSEVRNKMNITIQKAEEAFEEYWDFVFPKEKDVPEELPASYGSASGFYKKHFSEVRENEEFLYRLLIEKYNYKRNSFEMRRDAL